MLALRILSTVFLGISCIACFFKNILAYASVETDSKQVRRFFTNATTIYGWLWRALAIVTVWVI